MTRVVDHATVAADVVQGWFSGARRLAAGLLVSWRSLAGGCPIEFLCTDRWTAKIAAARLIGGGDDCEPLLRLGLLETDVLGWAPPKPCESEGESLALTKELGSRGIAAVIPVRRDGDAGFPWVAFDATSWTGFVVVRSVAELPPWMVNAPFSLLLHLAFAWRGQRLLHAASLGLEGRGALVVGPGGVGKSATTISGILAGLSTVGDDYVVLSQDEGFAARPVYRTLKQNPHGLSRLAGVEERTAGLPLNWHGKREFDADRIRPGCIASSLTIDAILIARQEKTAETKIIPAPPTAAFSALAPSTLFQLPGVSLAGFAAMLRLTRAVPAFWLHLSSDSEEIGGRLRDFMARRLE